MRMVMWKEKNNYHYYYIGDKQVIRIYWSGYYNCWYANINPKHYRDWRNLDFILYNELKGDNLDDLKSRCLFISRRFGWTKKNVEKKQEE